MKPNIGITDSNRQDVVNLLSILLADEFILYIKTRHAHWNLESPDFYTVHKFFETQFVALDSIIDAVAERVRILGHYTSTTLKNITNLTHLSETNNQDNDSQGFMKNLLEDHESIIIYLREIITNISVQLNDVGTSDFLTSVLEQHEKMAWFLRAHHK